MWVRDIHMNILVLNGYENRLRGIAYGHLHSLSLYSLPIVTSSNDPFNNFPIISSMNSLTFSRWCPVIVDASVPVVPDEHSLELRNLRFSWCRSHSPAFCCMTLYRDYRRMLHYKLDYDVRSTIIMKNILTIGYLLIIMTELAFPYIQWCNPIRAFLLTTCRSITTLAGYKTARIHKPWGRVR